MAVLAIGAGVAMRTPDAVGAIVVVVVSRDAVS